MRWDDARERVAERSAAVFGLDVATDELVSVRLVPGTMARRMLSGVLDGAELNAAVNGMRDATMNALEAMGSADTDGAVMASLYGAMTQILLLGIMVGSHPRGDGASQEPNDEFPGATQ